MRSRIRYRRNDSDWAQWIRKRRRLELTQREPEGVLLSRNYWPIIATLFLIGLLVIAYGLTSSH